MSHVQRCKRVKKNIFLFDATIPLWKDDILPIIFSHISFRSLLKFRLASKLIDKIIRTRTIIHDERRTGLNSLMHYGRATSTIFEKFRFSTYMFLFQSEIDWFILHFFDKKNKLTSDLSVIKFIPFMPYDTDPNIKAVDLLQNFLEISVSKELNFSNLKELHISLKHSWKLLKTGQTNTKSIYILLRKFLKKYVDIPKEDGKCFFLSIIAHYSNAQLFTFYERPETSLNRTNFFPKEFCEIFQHLKDRMISLNIEFNIRLNKDEKKNVNLNEYFNFLQSCKVIREFSFSINDLTRVYPVWNDDERYFFFNNLLKNSTIEKLTFVGEEWLMCNAYVGDLLRTNDKFPLFDNVKTLVVKKFYDVDTKVVNYFKLFKNLNGVVLEKIFANSSKIQANLEYFHKFAVESKSLKNVKVTFNGEGYDNDPEYEDHELKMFRKDSLLRILKILRGIEKKNPLCKVVVKVTKGSNMLIDENLSSILFEKCLQIVEKDF